MIRRAAIEREERERAEEEKKQEDELVSQKNKKESYKIRKNSTKEKLTKDLVWDLISDFDEAVNNHKDIDRMYKETIKSLESNSQDDSNDKLSSFFELRLEQIKTNIINLESGRFFFRDTPQKYIKNSSGELNDIQENIQENIIDFKNNNIECQEYIDEINLDIWSKTNDNELDEDEYKDRKESGLYFKQLLVENLLEIINNQKLNLKMLKNIKKNIEKIITNPEIKNKKTIKSSSQKTTDDVEDVVSEYVVADLAYKMVKEYSRTHRSNGEYHDQFLDKKLKVRLIKKYEELKQKGKSKKISKICKLNPKRSKMTILRHLTTPIRLPAGLQELERTGGLGMQWQISLTIALCACDYYDWDGEKENEEKVEQLAKDMWNYLKNDNDLMDLLRIK